MKSRLVPAAICASYLVACAAKPADVSQSDASGMLTPESLGTVGLVSMPLAPLPNHSTHERAGAFDGLGSCAVGFAATILFWAGAVYICPWVVPLINLTDGSALPPAKDRELIETAFRGVAAEQQFRARVLAHARSDANMKVRDLGTIAASRQASVDQQSRSAEKSVQAALEIGLLPVALVETGAKNDPHAELWIVARARLVRVSDRHVLADEQIDTLISNAELPTSERPGVALIKERTDEIHSKLDQLAAEVVSRVLPHASAVNATVAGDTQPDSRQDSEIGAPDLP